MRTTLTLDDDLAATLRRVAFELDAPFKRVVNDTLRRGLAAQEAPPASRPYRVRPASLGGVMPGIDLDKARHLATALEDEELARKLEQRK